MKISEQKRQVAPIIEQVLIIEILEYLGSWLLKTNIYPWMSNYNHVFSRKSHSFVQTFA